MPALAFFILAILVLLWKLDFIASLLNLKALQPNLPSEFEDVFDQERYQKSQRYTCENERISIIEGVISLTLLTVFWFIGGFEMLDVWVRSLDQGIIVTGIIYILLILLAQFLISIPLSLYKTFVIEEKFGFNKTTLPTFITDKIKGMIVGGIIGAPIIAIILWIFSIGNDPSSYSFAWLWAWLAFTIIQLALTYLAPTYLLPLFNKFEPMPDGELKVAIETMSAKCDFPLTELYVMDGSKRSTKSNAFFTGFGKNKKIALFDTLIEKHTTEELVGILAHEIGHFKCKHIVKRMATGIIQTAVIFFLLGLVTNPSLSFTQELFKAFFITEVSTHAGLILFFIIFSPFSRILGIFGNISSRKHEFEADAYAANAQGTSSHLTAALKKLSSDNLSNLTPHPLPVFLDYSHPPMIQRLKALKNFTPR